eukprot:4138230-Alexandrium_andersonii.AAC.1
MRSFARSNDSRTWGRLNIPLLQRAPATGAQSREQHPAVAMTCPSMRLSGCPSHARDQRCTFEGASHN